MPPKWGLLKNNRKSFLLLERYLIINDKLKVKRFIYSRFAFVSPDSKQYNKLATGLDSYCRKGCVID